MSHWLEVFQAAPNNVTRQEIHYSQTLYWSHLTLHFTPWSPSIPSGGRCDRSLNVRTREEEELGSIVLKPRIPEAKARMVERELMTFRKEWEWVTMTEVHRHGSDRERSVRGRERFLFCLSSFFQRGAHFSIKEVSVLIPVQKRQT